MNKNDIEKQMEQHSWRPLSEQKAIKRMYETPLSAKQKKIIDTVNEKGVAFYSGIYNERAIQPLARMNLLKAQFTVSDNGTSQIKVTSLAQDEIEFKELTGLND